MMTRRSSFFGKQLSELINVSDSNSGSARSSMNSSIDEQIITNHVSDMETEINEWRKMLQIMELQYKESVKTRERGNNLSTNHIEEYLTPEELTYIKSRPDATALAETLNNLSQLLLLSKYRITRLGTTGTKSVNITSEIDDGLKKQICLYLLLCDESADLF